MKLFSNYNRTLCLITRKRVLVISFILNIIYHCIYMLWHIFNFGSIQWNGSISIISAGTMVHIVCIILIVMKNPNLCLNTIGVVLELIVALHLIGISFYIIGFWFDAIIEGINAIQMCLHWFIQCRRLMDDYNDNRHVDYSVDDSGVPDIIATVHNGRTDSIQTVITNIDFPSL